jgi:hypothetical protein
MYVCMCVFVCVFVRVCVCVCPRARACLYSFVHILSDLTSKVIRFNSVLSTHCSCQAFPRRNHLRLMYLADPVELKELQKFSFVCRAKRFCDLLAS